MAQGNSLWDEGSMVVQAVSSDIVYLVMGVSSSGKSTFIERQIAAGVWKPSDIVMAYELGPGGCKHILEKGCVIHYNLLRPYENCGDDAQNCLFTDKILFEFIQYKQKIKCIFLVSSKFELKRRILQRTDNEKILRNTVNSYPIISMYDMLHKIDLKRLYTDWFFLFSFVGFSYDILDSTSDSYQVITKSTAYKLA